MAWPILFLIQITIGALIGGLTNELAIRMLFRPYKAYYIGKWRVPFTPGLIPKRHEELAFQMGKLVENFLITPDGVRSMLEKGEVKQEVIEWLLRKMDELEDSEDTVEVVLAKWGISLDSQLEEATKQQLKALIMKQLADHADRPLEEVLPYGIKQQLELKLGEISPILLKKFGGFLASDEGTVFIRQMLGQLAGGLGMLGGLASMLLSDEKVVNKVRHSLVDAFENKELQAKLSGLIQQEIQKAYKRNVDEVVEWIGKERVADGIQFAVDKVVAFDQLRNLKVNQLLSAMLPLLRAKVPSVINRLFDWAESHLEQGLKKINLTAIAARQVENFPVHMLERMIVSITGKELKMITVLGALLGGVIGAIQALLVLWLS
ncbi:hypothetical protein BEP19_04875 [Ammoniphilus oxalaticus]|uniref:DUF445 domain-containing protein n=1 Tax=Ammoniphilus oxalaticus TaxID=66863 RepID=A0A419SII1_9BACL|nr:DUF445 family protein [Ammoniphilus oxalaticus]RKD23766.1 hypothetical protein BEP19_04875 [Ammoniphilus oxalaticus]